MRGCLNHLAIVCCVTLVTPSVRAENYAFLVAVQDYSVRTLKPLKFTRNDIEAFSKVLQASGFKPENIVQLTDKPDRPRFTAEARKIRGELQLLLDSIDSGDTLIVAFSGHGVQFEGDEKNYYCPLDANLDDPKRGSLIPISEIYDKLKQCPAEKKLLLVDACRNDPMSLLNKSRETVRLKSVTRPQTEAVPKGVVALFSCAAGQESYEWPEFKHGIFFHHVLEGWNGAAADGNKQITLDDLVSYSRKKTQTFARLNLEASQTPQLKSDFEGTWVLRTLTATAAPAPANTITERSRVTDPEAAVSAAVKEINFRLNTYQIELDTTLGKIRLNLLPDVAPGHCRNFIGLTKIGFYDGLTFHRIIDGFMIQGGCPVGNGTGGPGYKIPAEFNDTAHEAGVLSMARPAEENSAGSQFFLCLARAAHLDKKYSAFGRTADKDSLQVVMKIGKTPTDKSDRPLTPVKINKAQVIVTPKS